MFSKFAAKAAMKSMPTMPSVNMPTMPEITLPNVNFSNIKAPSMPKSWSTWATPPPAPIPVAQPPVVGGRAPTSAKLKVPSPDGRPTILLFARHAGCPTAAKTMSDIMYIARQYPAIRFVIISHSSESDTSAVLGSIGKAPNVEILIDVSREQYARWGLGVSNTWYYLSPWTQTALLKAGRENEAATAAAATMASTGNRWQTSGAWAVDRVGVVKWGAAARSADDIPNFEEAVKALGL